MMSPPPKNWMHNAIHQAQKPKHSIISVLKAHLGGMEHARPREEVHASDITADDFCPRQWALLDLQEAKPAHRFVPVALAVTFDMGNEAERLLVEEWGGDRVIGNWRCRYCGDQRTMVPHPDGCCKDGRKHWWQYVQIRIEAPEYGVSGGMDALFNVGASSLLIVEVKTLNPTDFDKIVVQIPEHRYRTNLYMKLAAESHSPYKDKINTTEARVLYISRGYGIMNAQWNEILPFKEFEIKRDDASLTPLLQRAKALKIFRATKQGMPSGICDTAQDKYAKKCGVCVECFSGQYPATIHIGAM